MRNNVSTILKMISDLPKSQRVSALRQNDSDVMRIVLQYCYHDQIKWLLPEGDVPYTPNANEDQRNMFFSQARTLYLYVEGGNPNLKQLRREQLFIALLESIDPEDAKLVCSIKDKKLPYKGIKREMVLEAYPELFQ